MSISNAFEASSGSAEIVPFGEEHLERAAALFAARYQAARRREPLLPTSHEDGGPALQRLRGLAHNHGGVVALSEDRVVGFMLGQVMPSFRGRRTVYVPEWAHAATEVGGRRIYQGMYAHLAGRWVADGCLVHMITLLADDAGTTETFFWLGFGLLCVDALRDMGRPEDAAAEVPVRQADARDVAIVQAFDCALLAHLWSSPVLLPPWETASGKTVAAWLTDPRQGIFLAGPAEDPVAMVHVQPANPAAAFVISDPKTASIKAMFTRERLRTRGIGAALLDRALQWASAQGYERCAVDFESQNLPGSRFWLRHFRPVCYSMRRHVDDRPVTTEQGA